jgi:predicted transcriptional regulator
MSTAPINLKMTKAAAVLKLLQKGYSAKDIQEQLGVSLSYVHMLKKKLAEGVEEVVETVRQTAAEHTNKVKEMIEDWRAEAEADNDVDTILNERATTYGSFEDVAGCAQEIKNAIRICNNSELDDDQIEALDMIASKIARVVNGNPNHIDSWIDIAGYATLVADRLKGKAR